MTDINRRNKMVKK